MDKLYTANGSRWEPLRCFTSLGNYFPRIASSERLNRRVRISMETPS